MPSSRYSFSVVRLHPVNFATRKIISAIVIVLLVATGVAQQQTRAIDEPDPQQTRVEPDTHLTVPAGTRFALVLTHPVDSKSTHRGDEIYAVTTAPVTVGSHVVIPPGTFVQGKVEKLTRRGNRGEFLMQSLALIFPDGYVASIGGRANIESGEGTAWRNPSAAAKAGALAAPLAGTGLGALIGSAVHTTQSSTLGGTTLTTSTPKGLAIGSAVGGVAGGVFALVLIARSRDFYVEVGSPMEVILTEPLTLTQNRADGTSLRSRCAWCWSD